MYVCDQLGNLLLVPRPSVAAAAPPCCPACCFPLPCRTHRVIFMFFSLMRHPAAVLAKGGPTGFQPAKTWLWLSLNSFFICSFCVPDMYCRKLLECVLLL